MFRLNELTEERKQKAIEALILSKNEKQISALKKNMEALKIVINGGNTTLLKKEIASLSFGKAKELFDYINSILIGVQQEEQRKRFNDLSDDFPHLKNM
jgi:hypothetical protein